MDRGSNSLRALLGMISIAALLLLYVGCSGSVSGQVFIDSNGDGIYDTKEMGVPYAKVGLTRDGKKIAEHYTDENGYFDIPIKRTPGEICVSTDLSFAESNLDYIMYQADSEAPAAAMKVTPPAGMKAATTGDDETDDAGDDASDIDDTSDDADDDDDDDTGSVVETEEPESESAGWVGAKYCQNVKSKGFEVEIPVSMDYAGAIADLPKRLSVKCFAGAECDLTIPYPKGCTLHTIYLPEGLTPLDTGGTGITYNESMNGLTFAENAGHSGEDAFKASTAGAAAALAVSDYYIVDVRLKVADDIEVGEDKYYINPSAKCGDDTLELPQIPIDLERSFLAATYWHMESEPPYTSGKEVKITGKVQNSGDSSISHGDLTITPPEGSQVINTAAKPLPSGCLNNITSVICRIPKVGAGEIVSRTIWITLPVLDDSLPEGSSEEFGSGDVKFHAPGMEEAVTLSDTVESEDAEIKITVEKPGSLPLTPVFPIGPIGP